MVARCLEVKRVLSLPGGPCVVLPYDLEKKQWPTRLVYAMFDRDKEDTLFLGWGY